MNSSGIRLIRRCAGTIVSLVAAHTIAWSSLHAQDPVTGGLSVELRGIGKPGKIKGVVFDSLTMRAVPRAVVTMVGMPKPAIADVRGEFTFNDAPAGEQTLLFSTPDIDSLGFGTIGARVTVNSGEESRATIATPSLRTLWLRLCGESSPISSDSGIVWGAIRNAVSQADRPGAFAAFRWFDLDSAVLRGVRLQERRYEVKSGERGLFLACGVPTEVTVTSEALDSNAASGLITYALGERRVLRLDMLVSPDMVLADSAALKTVADSLELKRARGDASIRGTVYDEKKRPLSNAIVSLASADATVRSDKRGNFVLNGLPSGTHVLEIRRLGYAMRTRLVSLRPNVTDTQTVDMSGMNTLSTFNVRARSAKGEDRLAFESRRKLGTGFFLEGKDLTSRDNIETVLRTFPGTLLRYNAQGRFSVTMLNAGFSCGPKVFMDDMPTTFNFVAQFPPDYFRAVEVYNTIATIPKRYQMQYKEFICGVVLFWTRDAHW
ncbi:MAG: carboxypeptidase regulatory-like domain-containing protein [Gemmatimonas sp.]